MDSEIGQIVTKLWGQKLLFLCSSILGALVAILFKLLIGATYASTAIIYSDFLVEELKIGDKLNSIDSQTAVVSLTRILQSDAVARRAVERLGFDSEERVGKFSEVKQKIAALLGSTPPLAVDSYSRRLRDRIKIVNEPRSYLITVTYESGTPAEAARTTNAYVAAFIEVMQLQRIARSVASKRKDLELLRLINGPKHPVVLRAQSELDNLISISTVEERKRRESDDGFLSNSGFVTPAVANTKPAGQSTTAFLAFGAFMGAIVALGVLVLRHFTFGGSAREAAVVEAETNHENLDVSPQIPHFRYRG